jgi:hypothetical protein
MQIRRHIPGLALMLMLLLPASASATWGNGCSNENNNHCYALAIWNMAGEGEEVKGMSSNFAVYHMYVWPSYNGHGQSLQDEQWMSDAAGAWVEDGDLAGTHYYTEEGREENPYSIHWFYAYSYNGKTIPEYIAPWTYQGGEWIGYTLDDPSNNGTWCEQIQTTQVACQGGFPVYATRVELGMEAADEVQPENLAKSETGVQHRNGNWYHWNKAQLRTVKWGESGEEGAYVCIQSWASPAGYDTFGSPAAEC